MLIGSIQTGFESENTNPQPPKGGYEIVQMTKLGYTNLVPFCELEAEMKAYQQTVENY